MSSQVWHTAAEQELQLHELEKQASMQHGRCRMQLARRMAAGHASDCTAASDGIPLRFLDTGRQGLSFVGAVQSGAMQA